MILLNDNILEVEQGDYFFIQLDGEEKAYIYEFLENESYNFKDFINDMKDALNCDFRIFLYESNYGPYDCLFDSQNDALDF